METLVEKTSNDRVLPRSDQDGRLKVSLVDAADGSGLPVDSLPQSLSYDGAGRLSGVSVTHGGVVYTKALTYNDQGRLVTVSAWEAQP